MKKKRSWIIGGVIILVGILAVAGVVIYHLEKSYHTNEYLPVSASVITPKAVIDVRVADTDTKRDLGLSYFKSLPRNQGMLFLFDRPARYSFWMKGMNFALDMVWMKHLQGNNYQIVSITENAVPASYPNTFSPKAPVDAVLEINAFTAKGFGFSEGGEVRVASKGI